MKSELENRGSGACRLGAWVVLLFALGGIHTGEARSVPEAVRAGEPRSPENVLLFILDDVDVRAFASTPTPARDRLADLGVRFERAYSEPVCQMTRFALLFGRQRGTFNDAGPGLACSNVPSTRTPHPDLYSLAEMMRDAGYRTGFFGKWHLGNLNGIEGWERSPGHHGFEDWRAMLGSNLDTCGFGVGRGGSYTHWLRADDDGLSSFTNEYQASALQAAFRSWWTSTQGPRFACYSFQLAHEPFHAPPLPKRDGRPAVTQEGLYRSMLEMADALIGELVLGDGCAPVVDLRDTLVLILGDNGVPNQALPPGSYQFGQAKRTTYEGGVHVPMIASGAGVRARDDSDALVHVVDVLPTLADLVGAQPPPTARLEGVSFASVLAGAATSPRSHVFAAYDDLDTQGNPYFGRAVIGRRYKLRRVDRVPILTTTEYLYDLQEDPLELFPLRTSAPHFTSIRKELRRLLDGFEIRLKQNQAETFAMWPELVGMSKASPTGEPVH